MIKILTASAVIAVACGFTFFTLHVSSSSLKLQGQSTFPDLSMRGHGTLQYRNADLRMHTNSRGFAKSKNILYFYAILEILIQHENSSQNVSEKPV